MTDVKNSGNKGPAMNCYAVVASPNLRIDHVYKFVSRSARALWLARTPAGRAISARDARRHAILDDMEITYVSQ